MEVKIYLVEGPREDDTALVNLEPRSSDTIERRELKVGAKERIKL